MKKDQGPRDQDAEDRDEITNLDGSADRDRGGQLEPPDGSGGGNTTKSDI